MVATSELSDLESLRRALERLAPEVGPAELLSLERVGLAHSLLALAERENWRASLIDKTFVRSNGSPASFFQLSTALLDEMGSPLRDSDRWPAQDFTVDLLRAAVGFVRRLIEQDST